MQVPEPVAKFIELVSPDDVIIDDPHGNERGLWFLDIGASAVSWSESQGFGIFGSWSDGFGLKPDKIEADPEKAAQLYKEMHVA